MTGQCKERGHRFDRSPAAARETTLKAKKIFLQALPDCWIPRKGGSEYGIDYNVQLPENLVPTGAKFKTHIKGTKGIRFHDRQIVFSLETKKLKHYYKTKQPVFFILVDVNNSNVFWLFTQEYIKELDQTTPGWRRQKTVSLKIPPANKLNERIESFQEAVIKGQQFVHLLQFQLSYSSISQKIENVIKNSAHHFSGQFKQIFPKTYPDSSCSCFIEENPFDLEIENSLKRAEKLRINDPKENREAYEQICNALEHAGCSASPGIRYLALGEKHYHNYMFYLVKAFDMENKEDEQHYFSAIEGLVETISSSIDAGELTTASTIILRLADVYFHAFPYVCTAYGNDQAFTLLDSAHSLLELADNMVTIIESPNRVIQ